MPPSTCNKLPVINDDLSEARKAIDSATSSGLAIRPSGCILLACLMNLEFNFFYFDLDI